MFHTGGPARTKTEKHRKSKVHAARTERLRNTAAWGHRRDDGGRSK